MTAPHIPDHVVAAYLNNPTGSAAREEAAGRIAAAAAGTIRAALNDYGTTLDLAPAGTREEVAADALLAILNMAAAYDPGRGVPFGAWVSATGAPWRRTLHDLIRNARHGLGHNRADRRVLAVYDHAAGQYEQTHGRPPDASQRQTLLAAAVAARAAESGTPAAAAAQRNTRSGFTAAARHLDRLLDSRHPVSIDADRVDGTTLHDTLPAPADPRIEAVESADTVAAWRRLAGPLDTDTASHRMRCPHAQWLHLSTSANLPDHPRPRHGR